MNIAELLKKKIIFVSGKGGCGKTSLSILLGLLAERMEKKVLIVEMNSTDRVAPLFHRQKIGHHPTVLTDYISAMNLSPKECFEDYAVSVIYFHTLYKAFLDNSFVNNFLNAAPGLKEFLMLRKILELQEESEHAFFSKKTKYDLIIVDAPATGHGLSVLEVPKVLADVTKMGPLYTQANRIMDVLGDPKRTAFCVVTLAEEMPVCETQEYVEAIKAGTRLHFGPMFINSLMPEVAPVQFTQALPSKHQIFQDYYNLSTERHDLNQAYLEEIDRRFPDFNKIRIPFQFDGLGSIEHFHPLCEELLEAISD